MDTQSLPEMPLIAETVRPASVAELADFLRGASEAGQPAIPMGGGTSLHTGNVTTESYTGIDTRALTGVREYHPTDLTASFRAGTTLAEVRDTLAEHGQELPVDLVLPDTATIGGMVATGFAGPRRLDSGTLKDLIIGAEYVRGDSLIAKAGGMLVKNVSGYEIPRFLHGSWGALAVITAINLKVIPKPKADVSFTHHEASLQAALDGQLSMLRHHPGVVALVTARDDDGWATTARLVGRASSVQAQIEGFRDDLGSDTIVREGVEPWDAHNARWSVPDGSVHVLIGGRANALRDLSLALASHEALVDLVVSLGTGSLRVALSPERVSRADLDSFLAAKPLTWTIEAAPAAWRGQAGVWGPPRADAPLARAIKTEFDPANILNRGRLFI